jgi:biotin carboxylase
MKKVMVLGAGSCQLNLIRRLKDMGHQVIATGYNREAPGKKIADFSVLADTFSYEGTLKAANQFNIDAIITTGTDQPVLTATKVAEKLNLPRFLSNTVAYHVTNKKAMKKKFSENNIPTVPYEIVNKESDISKLGINGPIVMKPLDSQGQRGIFKLASKDHIKRYIDETLKFSRSDEVLIEKYYENQEITISGWVSKGKVNIFTISDRVTFENNLNIGVCKSHEYPSIHLKKYKDKIIHLTKKICRVFKITEGPIYFQMLIGKAGILVNEIACRLGGAYEDITIPIITGIDPLKLLIHGSLNKHFEYKALENYSYSENNLCISTQLFFCESGWINSMTPVEEMLEKDFIVDIGYNYKKGDYIHERVNASQRAGYMIIQGETEEVLNKNIAKAFSQLKIENSKGKNLVVKGKRGNRE